MYPATDQEPRERATVAFLSMFVNLTIISITSVPEILTFLLLTDPMTYDSPPDFTKGENLHAKKTRYQGIQTSSMDCGISSLIEMLSTALGTVSVLL